MTTNSQSQRSDGFFHTSTRDMASNAAAGAVAVLGGRSKMEDAVSVHPKLCSPVINRHLPVHFFAVFDGHEGSEHFSNICKEKMHEILKEELMAVPAPGYITEESALHEAWRLLMNRVFIRTEKAAMDTCECGSEGFNCACNFDRELLSLMGTTAVALVVTEKHLVVANCGDSRAVLYRSGRPIPLSSDHKATRADEKARIEGCGGRVLLFDIPRVQGCLSMTRAIGDAYLKPCVTSEVELSLTRRGEEDEFVVIASDGMWDVIPNEMAGRVAAYCLRRPMSEDVDGCLSAASALTQLAICRGSSDNISVVVVDLTTNARAAA